MEKENDLDRMQMAVHGKFKDWPAWRKERSVACALMLVGFKRLEARK